MPLCPSCSKWIFIHQRQPTAYWLAISLNEISLVTWALVLTRILSSGLHWILKRKGLHCATHGSGWACTKPIIYLHRKMTSRAPLTSCLNGKEWKIWPEINSTFFCHGNKSEIWLEFPSLNYTLKEKNVQDSIESSWRTAIQSSVWTLWWYWILSPVPNGLSQTQRRLGSPQT